MKWREEKGKGIERGDWVVIGIYDVVSFGCCLFGVNGEEFGNRGIMVGLI